MLVQKCALVQAIARMKVEREIDDGGSESEAAELDRMLVSAIALRLIRELFYIRGR